MDVGVKAICALLCAGPVWAEDVSWVQNNAVMSVDWVAHEGSATLTYDTDGRATFRSETRPQLVDVDGDGWLDLADYELVGMVNGDYLMFRYDPLTGRFARWGQMNGHTFIRDEAGYFVAVGRGNAATTYFDFYNPKERSLLHHFVLEVSAHNDPAQNGGKPQCGISFDFENFVDVFERDIHAAHVEMIQHYCDAYKALDAPDRGVDLWADDPALDIVPAGTVFYCRLEGGRHAVSVTRDAQGYTYRYGPVGGPPELELVRPASQVDVLPDNGAGPSRFGEMTFANGDYSYGVFYTYELFDAGGDLLPANGPYINATLVRGLQVMRGDNVLSDKRCILGTSYDAIAQL